MRFRSVATVAGVLVGLTASLFPVSSAQAAGAHRTVVTVAHRGASAYAPENTLAAVDAAADLGFAWVENDVQRTKDGELVVLHDTSLARTTNVEQVFPGRAPWNVADFTLAEIEKLDAGSWFGPKFTGERVPTLEDYMDTVEDNDQNLLLEIKSPELYPGIERQILKELREDGWLDRDHVKRRLVVQSFSADSVKKVHSLRPDIKTGFLGTPAAAELPKYAAFADQINPQYKSIDAGYVASVHKVKGPHGRPLEVFTWTIDDAANAVKAAGQGVNGIISNKPDVVRNALEKTGR
ncbi:MULTISPECIES: glycerophosphodiester phosphodiesterase family protein [Streptomyces]|uniref:Glycerophosphodiester phosphodiesterase n=2 Tax=Streptomyces rimosus subsp. rimosus TaxID=132474 RepID=L8EMD3_STRR1|nr:MULTISPECIES: glycerophosphodiester phosphodiesterase family protein [Streptomyces]KOG80527.1 glycerophosphodiester phosphodiesterase [Kitasatospora aureofaciens]MYT44811.1 glycerophosphodiester phosphodiesterase [Streptomyces sp. SID5471]KEF03376.1 glycerophosphodiester phosphodiesterase [Streptomyces rimosus]KEF17601.1 glycerophosphodiester phosphodiesterase [Streptomyces rimosus]KOT30671.1 glycerophosphodiester phosphodiesterase [Streptomyces rimosus subsp. rimosus]